MKLNVYNNYRTNLPKNFANNKAMDPKTFISNICTEKLE